MNLVRGTTSDYSCSYSYRRIDRRKQRRNFIIWNRIVGSILLLLSFFVLFMLPDQDGNWTLTGLMVIVAIALFMQNGGLKHD
ncbi:hypothetical protein [Acetobacterium wieringae]|uniref:hypothetical protein n=1 Tax=Acetobacterium wieringae TaxID=52694 RepID=UPI0026F30893|nr:hypothetical protein [Acetobacterium wieringae]